MTKDYPKNAAVCIENDSGSDTPACSLTDPLSCPLCYPPANSLTNSRARSLTRLPDCPLTCFPTRSLTNPLTNLGTDSLSYSVGNLLSHLRGHPLGDTPSLSRFSYNIFIKQRLRRIFASIFMCLLGTIF
jgi:hypothetical protein